MALLRFAILLLLPLAVMYASPAEVLAQDSSARPADSSAATPAESDSSATASRGVGNARQSANLSIMWASIAARLGETYAHEVGHTFAPAPTFKPPNPLANGYYEQILNVYIAQSFDGPLISPQTMSVGAASGSETASAAAKGSYTTAPDSLLNKRVNQALRRAALEAAYNKGGVTDEQYHASKALLLLAECHELLRAVGEKGDSDSTTVANLTVLLPDGSMLGTGLRATVVGTTPRPLLTWLKLGDSIISLQRLYDGGQISKREYDLKLEDIGAREDQIAALLPLSLEGVVFTVQTVTGAGLSSIKDFDVQPFPELGTLRFVNERDPAPQPLSEMIRNWISTTVASISAMCALMALALGVWQATKRAPDSDAEPACVEPPGPPAPCSVTCAGAHSFDLAARLDACRAAVRARRGGLTN